MTNPVDKDSLPLNQPRRTPNHPTKSHIVKTKVDGKEKIIRFGQQGASTAGKPEEGESDRMKAKRASFKARHSANIAKGPSSAAYWANKVKWADGGSVRLNYAEGDSVRVTPQNAALGKIAQTLQSAKEFGNRYEVKPWVPLIGGTGVGDMLMGKAPQEVENWSYGNYPMNMPAMSHIPQFKTGRAESFGDAVLLGIDAAPVVGALGKVSGKAGKAGARVVGEELNRAILDSSGPLARLVPEAAKPLYAVKPKGGNWAPAIGSKDSVEAALQPLKRQGQGIFAGPLDSPDQAANKWLDTKLQKYIRNDMGTPDDPIRLAHEEGYSHIPGDLAEEFGSWLPEDTAAARRSAGYPEHGFAVQKHMDAGYPEAMEANTRKAELWENLADTEIKSSPAGAYQEQFRVARDFPSIVGNQKSALQMAERNPWIEKLDRNTPIYKIDSPIELNTNLGFGHMTDELHNMLDPESGLPANLRLTPEQLEKVTVKQMVERVSKVNDWRAEEAAKAEREGMMGNLTATPRLEVPEAKLSFVDKPGMTWVDIPATTDESAKKLCTTIGRQAGWCTQGEGLAKSYGSGENRLTTLIDAEGRPHAQAMLSKPQYLPSWEDAKKFLPAAEKEAKLMPNGYTDADVSDIAARMAKETMPVNITELKPVGNEFSSARAREYEKRDPQYQAKITDSVLKFLNAGEWGKVNDLDHYNIVDLHNSNSVKQTLRDVTDYDLPHERMDKFTAATHFNPDAPRFMSRDQFREFLEPREVKEGFAEGGRVRAGEGLPDPSLLNFSLYADTVSREMFPYESDNAKRDAARHMLASALAAQKTTPGIAEFLGKAHEFKESPFRTAGHWLGLSAPRADYPTDIHNNALGVQLGSNAKSLQELLDSIERETNRGTPKTQKGRASLQPDAETRYAEGGLVGDPVTTYDPFQVDEIMNSINTPQNYAEGGSVSAYDPDQVDAIANQFM